MTTANVNYDGLIKRLVVPDGAVIPRRLAYDGLIATALTRNDLSDDVHGINVSMELIRRTRGGGWPAEPVTEDFNYVDLVWHECEFRDAGSYAYVLRRTDGGYLGCLYLYPLGRRTPLSAAIVHLDVDVSWWVTPEGYAEGFYTMVFTALQHWFAAEFDFWAPHYSNHVIPSPGPSQ